jgi:hypothetical protein
MMQNYLADAMARLRGWPRLGLAPEVTDRAVLGSAFPGLRYVWLRRQGKVRQAVSSWRADMTGEYARPAGASPSPPPAFDGAAIAGLVRYAEACEAGWRDWFGAHAIKPFQITYEDLTGNLDKAVRDVAGFLDVTLPPGLGRIRPRLQRYHLAAQPLIHQESLGARADPVQRIDPAAAHSRRPCLKATPGARFRAR